MSAVAIAALLPFVLQALELARDTVVILQKDDPDLTDVENLQARVTQLDAMKLDAQTALNNLDAAIRAKTGQ